jgi:hypothetical protein
MGQERIHVCFFGALHYDVNTCANKNAEWKPKLFRTWLGNGPSSVFEAEYV